MAESESFGGGRYRAVRPLGRGGQKKVYLVRDTLLDRDCALSLVDSEELLPDEAARLQSEAQALAQMGAHPHVVTVYDLGFDQGRPYIVSEYVAGGDLAAVVERAQGPLPIGEALRITGDILRGLEAIHLRGIVHRDLKPSNVWLDPSGTAKLRDFGLALAAGRSRKSAAGTITGTPGYVAPEQLQDQPVDGRADLYALGCILYELTTGRPPFVGPVVAVISQHLHAQPGPPSRWNPDLPPSLERLILRLLSKDPAARPSTAGEVMAELSGATDAPAPPPPPPIVPVPPPAALPPAPSVPKIPIPEPPRRLRWWAFGAMLTVLAALGIQRLLAPAPPPAIRRLAVVAIAEPGQAASASVSWTLALRLVEEIDRYAEFRPVSPAGILGARIHALGSTQQVPDLARAIDLAEHVRADTIAALTLVPAKGGTWSAAIQVFDREDPASGAAAPRERLTREALDADGPAQLAEVIAALLRRHWALPSLTDLAEGRASRRFKLDAYAAWAAAEEWCLIGRWEVCEEKMALALAQDPHNALFHTGMARALSYQAGREAEASRHVKQAIALRAEVTSRHVVTLIEENVLWVGAERAMQRGDREESRRLAAKLLKATDALSEEFSDPWGDLFAASALQYFLDDPRRAREHYARARERGPALFAGYYEEAKLLRGGGKDPSANDAAAKLLWTFIECQPSSPMVANARTILREWDLERPAGELSCPGAGPGS